MYLTQNYTWHHEEENWNFVRTEGWWSSFDNGLVESGWLYFHFLVLSSS